MEGESQTAAAREDLIVEKQRGFLLAAVLGGVLTLSGCSQSARKEAGTKDEESGATLFSMYCATCHPNGANVINPPKSLQRLTLAANGITTPEGIVAKIRNPGPRMKRFDPMELSDERARKIADYILETFK
jgi:cytochrome c6